jgi:hypothetical protein
LSTFESPAAGAVTLPGPVPDLGMRAQLDSLYAEREQLAAILGTADADGIVAIVDAARAEADELRAELAALRRLRELQEAEVRLAAEQRRVQAELAELQARLGHVVEGEQP